MSEICCAVYINSTAKLLSNAELIDIFKCESEENKRDEITGFSIYNDGAFFHYIEGMKSILEYKEARIKESLLHRGVIELFSEHVEQRRFDDWHMGFLKPRDVELLNAINDKFWNTISNLRKNERCDSLELLDIFCKNESRFRRRIYLNDGITGRSN